MWCAYHTIMTSRLAELAGTSSATPAGPAGASSSGRSVLHNDCVPGASCAESGCFRPHWVTCASDQVMEYVKHGELFDLIVERGHMSDSEARRYFQQLIAGVEYCHAHMVRAGPRADRGSRRSFVLGTPPTAFCKTRAFSTLACRPDQRLQRLREAPSWAPCPQIARGAASPPALPRRNLAATPPPLARRSQRELSSHTTCRTIPYRWRRWCTEISSPRTSSSTGEGT